MVYSRQEALVDKERVRVQGEVRVAGEYVRFSEMRVRDLFTVAGGITPEASLKAEIARPGEQGRLVLIPIELDQVMARSDSPANIQVRDLDVLVVRKELRKRRWPASVTLIGEFNKPGEYAVDPERETLSDVVRRAGGMTELAYPRAAVFNRRIPEILAEDTDQTGSRCICRPPGDRQADRYHEGGIRLSRRLPGGLGTGQVNFPNSPMRPLLRREIWIRCSLPVEFPSISAPFWAAIRATPGSRTATYCFCPSGPKW